MKLSLVCLLLFLLLLPHTAWAYPGNCVATLKRAGYLPNGRVTRDGYARSIPVISKELPPEGKVVVIVTAESWMGHVRLAKLVNGQLVNILDSVNGKKPVIINQKLYRGYLEPSSI